MVKMGASVLSKQIALSCLREHEFVDGEGGHGGMCTCYVLCVIQRAIIKISFERFVLKTYFMSAL